MPGQINVLYTYRLTLNGFALSIPVELKDKFLALPGVIGIEEQDTLPRPEPFAGDSGAADKLTAANSVNFIGGGAAHALAGAPSAG